MKTKDQRDGDDHFDLFRADGSLDRDNYLELDDTNSDGPLMFFNRDSGEGSSTRNDDVHSNVASWPGRLGSGIMRSQPGNIDHRGLPRSPSSESDIERLEVLQSTSSQIDTESSGTGSRKRRRALSPSPPSQSLSDRPILQHHR